MMIFVPNRTFLVRFDGVSGEFGRAMVLSWRDAIEPKYSSAEVYQKGAIRYLPYPNSAKNPPQTRRPCSSYACQVRSANCVDLLLL